MLEAQSLDLLVDRMAQGKANARTLTLFKDYMFINSISAKHLPQCLLARWPSLDAE